MNQLDMHDPDEDLLRRALAAEAEGVTADDAFATRVAAAVVRDTRRRRARAAALALGAAALVVVGLVAVTRPGGSDDVRTDEAPPAVTPATRPDVIALVLRDGWLITVDTRTGERYEVYLNVPASDLGRRLSPVDEVALSPDGRWVYFSQTPQGAAGPSSYRIPATGGEAELIGAGTSPAVSPDGELVATSDRDAFILTPADGGQAVARSRFMTDGIVQRLSWSPDGAQLSYVTRGDDGRTRAWAAPVGSNGEAITVGEPEPIPDPRQPSAGAEGFVTWSPEGEPFVLLPAPEAHRGLSQDASGRWLLWVTAEGTLKAQEWGSREVVAIPDVPAAVAADW